MYAYNKCDKYEGTGYAISGANTVFISAKTGEGIDTLLSRLDLIVQGSKRPYLLRFPYDAQGELNRLYGSYSVEDVDYRDDGIYVRVSLDSKGAGRFGRFACEE